MRTRPRRRDAARKQRHTGPLPGSLRTPLLVRDVVPVWTRSPSSFPMSYVRYSRMRLTGARSGCLRVPDGATEPARAVDLPGRRRGGTPAKPRSRGRRDTSTQSLRSLGVGRLEGGRSGHVRTGPQPSGGMVMKPRRSVLTAASVASVTGAILLTSAATSPPTPNAPAPITKQAVAVGTGGAVADPFVAGIGGGGFLVYYDARTHEVTTIDGRETAPALATADLFIDPATGKPLSFPVAVTSGLSVGVPGTLMTWEKALAQWGTRSL